MSEPAWLQFARTHLGLAEVPGKETHPKIRRWLIEMGAWWTDDEMPWCGTFMDACFRAADIEPPAKAYRALEWWSWGVPLVKPVLGCVVVYRRKGGGHVGLVVGEDYHGNLMTLGGNQGNRVSIVPFSRTRAIGFRWPVGLDIPAGLLPSFISDGVVSSQEA